MLAVPKRPVTERHLDGARLTVPGSIRRALGRHVCLSAHPAGAVLITPASLWNDALQALARCAQRGHHAAQLLRLLETSRASAVVDVRGRVSLPHELMEYADLVPDRPVVVVELAWALEVWDPRRLDIVLRVARRQMRRAQGLVGEEQMPLFDESDA